MIRRFAAFIVFALFSLVLSESLAQSPYLAHRRKAFAVPTPDTLTGLVTWMRASDLVGVVADGDPIDTWTDRMGNGNATAVTTARPLFRATGFNGRPGIEFTSTDAFTFSKTVSSDWTVIAVVMPNNYSAHRLWSHNSAGSFGTTPYFSVQTSGKLTNSSGTGTPLAESFDAIEIDYPYIHTCTMDSGGSTGPRNQYFNRTLSHTATVNNFNYVVTTLGNGGANQWLGFMGEYLIYDHDLTDAELNTVYAYLESRWACQHRYIICDGDSLTRGHSASAGAEYPTVLKNSISAPGYTVKNYGVDSQTIADVASDVATQADRYAVRTSGENVYVAWVGTNDLFTGRTAAQVKTDYAALCTARQAAGFRVVACTIMNHAITGSWTQADADDVNTYIRANYTSWADDLADIQANANLQTTTDTTYFQADGVHLTDAGYAIVADIVKSALTTWLNLYACNEPATRHDLPLAA